MKVLYAGALIFGAAGLIGGGIVATYFWRLTGPEEQQIFGLAKEWFVVATPFVCGVAGAVTSILFVRDAKVAAYRDNSGSAWAMRGMLVGGLAFIEFLLYQAGVLLVVEGTKYALFFFVLALLVGSGLFGWAALLLGALAGFLFGLYLRWRGPNTVTRRT